MKKLIIASCFLISMGAYTQQVARSLTAPGPLFIGFYEYTPVDYNVDLTKKYPLIIFLHGIGERGNGTTQLPFVLANAIPKYINAGHPMRFTSLSGVQETFLVLSPQLSTAYGSWQNIYVDEMLKYAKANLRVDTNRIFLTGLSLGGGGTWKYATASTTNARQFASIAVTCGTCEWGNMCNLASVNLPVWAFHATDDGTVGVSCTHNAINMMMSCNPTVLPIKTIYSSGNHWIWDMSFDTTHNWQNPNVFEWFLGQGKNLPANRLPVANAGPDRVITLPLSDVALNGTASSDIDGTIRRYIWKIIQSPGGGWLEDPSAGSTFAHNLSQGVYRFELTVVDDRASWKKDTIMVTVNPSSANLPPIAQAGPDSITTLLTVNIDASSSYDVDGFVSAYNWRQLSGPSAALISCASCASTNMTNLANGIFRMEVEVTDNLGARTRDTVQILETGSILPAGILYFKGRNRGEENLLEWATANEFNSHHFEIQRSSNGQTFESIGNIPAAGISKSTREYAFADQHAPEKLNYYRLMQVDQDGSFKYSAVVTLNNNKGKWYIETYPNPVVEELQVQVIAREKGSMSLRLINQHGQLIRSLVLPKNTDELKAQMNIKEIPAGVYFLELRIGESMKEIRKIIKE
ncbi:MAG TPA: T9SS type A sorting domain-containing protein [Chitinophagaceae bacterium]|nr:T9SS type A sorting domain-containing protein [Chitinophagaceae bacterium]